ncbi:isoprenylcysteine carboxylmethyltransferase family protein [candidate division KSB1 bacterium]|nr:isoprenylcysteine carboxylmethyltransferase family protein [candidate division KSB1 bacterium]
MKTHNNSSHRRHSGRDDLIGEYRWGDIWQVILLVIFLVVWIADSFFLQYSTWLISYVPSVVRLIFGLSFSIGSVIMARTSLNIVFGEVREKPEVITKGLFGIVRHPVYLSAILLYLGFISFSLSLLSVMVWVVIIGFYHFLARYEERLLLVEFGEEYETYMKRVPMWIPKLGTK